LDESRRNALSPRVHERRIAVYELATSNSQAAAPTLLGKLRDSDLSVRRFAALGLGLLRDQHAVLPLIAILAGDDAASLRREAAWALGRLGDQRARPELAKLLKDSHSEMRRSA